MAVAADQKEIITTMGPANPLVSLPMLRNTRAKILELQGIKDVDNYYLPIPPDWQPPQPPAPQPSPEELWVQAEKEMAHQKTMKELAIKQDELALKREQMTFDQQFQLHKLASEQALRRFEIEATTNAKITAEALDREIETDVAETELAMKAHDQLHEHQMQEDRQAHEKEMAERQASAAEAAATASEAE
jgi:hypothetical protein